MDPNIDHIFLLFRGVQGHARTHTRPKLRREEEETVEA